MTLQAPISSTPSPQAQPPPPPSSQAATAAPAAPAAPRRRNAFCGPFSREGRACRIAAALYNRDRAAAAAVAAENDADWETTGGLDGDGDGDGRQLYAENGGYLSYCTDDSDDNESSCVTTRQILPPQ